MGENAKRSGGIFLFFIMLIVAFFLFVPLPHDVTVTSTEQVPYIAIEQYQEYVLISVEECKTDLPRSEVDLLFRSINFLLEGDVKKIYETCENVNKLETVTKTREVVRYRQVTSSRITTRHDSLFRQWFD